MIVFITPPSWAMDTSMGSAADIWDDLGKGVSSDPNR